MDPAYGDTNQILEYIAGYDMYRDCPEAPLLVQYMYDLRALAKIQAAIAAVVVARFAVGVLAANRACSPNPLGRQ